MVLIVGQNSVWQNTYNLSTLEIGSVNRVAGVFASAAGKGSNVARALGFLGHESLLLAYVGGPNGGKFAKACEEDGIRSDFTEIARETRICTTLIEDSGRITEVVEPAPAVSQDERESFHASFDRSIRGATLLVVSGTAMTGENEDCYLEFVQKAHRAGLSVVLDSYRNHGKRALEASPEVLKINADELRELSGTACDRPEGRSTAAKDIMERFGVRWIIITRGKEGAEAYDERRAFTARPPKVTVKNVIGSGDSFTAGIIGSLLPALLRAKNRERNGFPWGADLRESLKAGASMGTANCMNIKPGRIEPFDFDRVHRSLTVTEVRA